MLNHLLSEDMIPIAVETLGGLLKLIYPNDREDKIQIFPIGSGREITAIGQSAELSIVYIGSQFGELQKWDFVTKRLRWQTIVSHLTEIKNITELADGRIRCITSQGEKIISIPSAHTPSLAVSIPLIAPVPKVPRQPSIAHSRSSHSVGPIVRRAPSRSNTPEPHWCPLFWCSCRSIARQPAPPIPQLQAAPPAPVRRANTPCLSEGCCCARLGCRCTDCDESKLHE